VGGWILDHSSSPLLFTLTLAGVTASALASIGLPPVRHPAESGERVEMPAASP